MNPELQRNLWLEATPRRIAWVCVALALVLGAVGVVTGMGGEDARSVGRALGITGFIVYVVSALLWGSREAGQSVTEEIGWRTWEFQRLSALTPWTMTWGKLAGAPSVAWLAALVGLMFAAADRAVEAGGASATLFILSALAAGVLFHAVSMASALISVRKARAEARLATLRGSIFGLVVLLIIAWAAAGLLGARTDWLDAAFAQTPVVWWGQSFGRQTFTTVALIVFAAWAVSGVWRLMRLELQARNTPWWWPAFLIFAAVFAAGLAEGATARWLAAFAVFVVGAYLSVFAEPADRVRLRGLPRAIGEGDWERAANQTPAVLPALVLALLGALGLSLAAAGAAADTFAVPSTLSEVAATAGRVIAPAWPWAILAFLLRDLGVVAYFRFGARPRRGDFGAVLALGLLYMVGGVLGSLFGDDAGGALFYPSPEQPIVSIVAALLQAFLIWTLAVRRIAGPDRPPEAEVKVS